MNTQKKLYILFILLTIVGILILVIFRNPWCTRVGAFDDQLRADHADVLSPVTVEIRERVSENVDYPERLLIVRPMGWYLYTTDGMAFYYFTNQIGIDCPDERISAVVYRLSMTVEASDGAALDRLRTKCLNYKLNTVVRLFAARNIRRTDVDLSGCKQLLKKITIESVLDTLLDLNVI